MTQYRVPAYDHDAGTLATGDGLFWNGSVWVPQSVKERLEADVAPGSDGNVLTASGGAWSSAAPAGWEYVEEIDESGIASWGSTTLEEGYLYRLVMNSWERSSSFDNILIRVDTGSGYDSGASDYLWVAWRVAVGVNWYAERDTADDAIHLLGNGSYSHVSSSSFETHFDMLFWQRNSDYWRCHINVMGEDRRIGQVGGRRNSTSAVVGLELRDANNAFCTFTGHLWRIEAA